MSAYRFCRTDDIGLLVDALNRCWSPYVPDEPLMTPARFKRSIRDLQVWCSSCMVAFAGTDPVGVLIGAKRPSATLIHTIAVHPDHRRQGHGRHLLASLGSKLAILGPPRIIAEVPEVLAPACGLFTASGYAQEAVLTDYVLSWDENDRERDTKRGEGPVPSERIIPPRVAGFVIPVTVDDLAANGLLGDADGSPGVAVCWERSVETLRARKDEVSGLAVASDERIEAYLLYVEREGGEGEIVALRSVVDDGAARLADLLSRLRGGTLKTVWFPKVCPTEIAEGWLETLGFSRAGDHLLYVATARSQ
jgi:GNAT superfamily N-acetyltransferase